jgi:protein SCO1/2
VGATIALDAPFTSSIGEPVTLAKLAAPGRPIVLVLAYARCRMLCSVVLRGLADAIHNALPKVEPGRAYLPVIVSLDPEESAAEAYQRQATLLGLAGLPATQRDAWPYLVGRETSIRALADSLGFHYAWDPKTEQFAHPAAVFVVTPDGRLARTLRGVTFDGLATATESAARGELVRDDAAFDLLRCFHYDPSLRRYGARLSAFFRLGATAILTALTIAIAALLRAEIKRRGARRP